MYADKNGSVQEVEKFIIENKKHNLLIFSPIAEYSL